ncbi:unnamed protein product [Ambrosiozyma monospora]|uniref:Ribosome-recycling factor, mitochondrial n=1 Tax=Ambrosiozyma monospora TaxID=43982 RepID=A0A9W7DMU2_AMBMO|nr:unnamed protein product [Ambrosiozyma monospora]
MLRNQTIKLAKLAVAKRATVILPRQQLSAQSQYQHLQSLSSPFSIPLSQVSYFSTTSATLAKKKGGNKKENKKDKRNHKDDAEEDGEPVEEIDPKQILSGLETSFKKTLDLYNKKITEIKMGKANPTIFNNLVITIDKKDHPFTDLAAASLQNKNLTVTVFDPNNAKRIISAILAANLGLTPELDPKNNQLLKIKNPLTSSKDVTAKQLKELKEAFDNHAKNNSSSHSLVSLRGKVIKDLKKVEGSKDVVRKLTTDVEKLYKSYVEKLTDSFKKAEKSLK